MSCGKLQTIPRVQLNIRFGTKQARDDRESKLPQIFGISATCHNLPTDQPKD